MSSKAMILLMITHVVTDFLLQDRETAKNKSSSYKYLIPHVFLIYSGLLIWGYVSGLGFTKSFEFAALNAGLHALIDKHLWTLYKYIVVKRFPEVLNGMKFEYWEDSWFYNFIALDQLLHGVCYVLIYNLVTGGTLF